MEKAPDALRTISEVAQDLDVPNHVLRFWETRFKQLKPMKRGGGRRYYRPADVQLLRGIHHLLYSDGFTIRGVQQILKRDGVKQVKTCWQTDAQPNIPDVAGEAAKLSSTPSKVKQTKDSVAPLLSTVREQLLQCQKILERMRQV